MSLLRVYRQCGSSVQISTAVCRSMSSSTSQSATSPSSAPGACPHLNDINTDYENAKPYNTIPGPSRLQLVRMFMPGGTLRGMQMSAVHRHFHDQFGPLLKLPGMMGKPDILITLDPQQYDKVFRTEGAWPYRRGIETFDHYRTKVRPEVFKGFGGLVSDQGETWHKMRTAVSPVMLRPATVRSYVPTVDSIAREFLQKMHMLRDAKDEMPADFGTELSLWALESIGMIALDRRLNVLSFERDEEAQKLVQATREFFVLSYRLEMMPPIWKYYKTKDYLKLMDVFDTMTNVVEKHLSSAAKELEQEDPSKVSTGEESIMKKLLKTDKTYAMLMAFDMFFAGIDTTSSTTATLLYNLAQNPEQQKKLTEEVFRLLPDIDSPMSKDVLENSPYFRATLKESLRVTPLIVGTMRAAGQDLTLSGYKVPKGTHIALSQLIGKEDDDYFPRAKTFMPERWLRENKETLAAQSPKSTPFAYLPFGYGPRSCIGRRFAEMEIQVLTMRILREYRVEWHHDPMEYVMSFVIAPAKPLRFRLVRHDA